VDDHGPASAACLAVLCNPESGRVRGARSQIHSRAASLEPDLFREGSSPAQITSAVREALAEGAEVLTVLGGDGTIHAVLTALHSVAADRDWPQLVPLPAGSTNMTALDLGSGGDLDRALSALERWRAGARVAMKSVFRAPLRLQRPGRPCLSGMFFGTGVIAEGVRFFRRRIRSRGRVGEAWSLLALLRALTIVVPGSSADEGDGRLWWRRNGQAAREVTARACLASTLDRLLLGTRPYWGSEEDGPIHLTVVEEEARALWTSLWRIARGRPGTRLTPERGYSSHDVRRVELRFDGSFAMDGELFEARWGDGTMTLEASRDVSWLVPRTPGR